MKPVIKRTLRAIGVAATALSLVGGAWAQGRGHGGGYHGGGHHGGYHRGGGWGAAPWIFGGVGLGLGLGLGSAYASPYYYGTPAYVYDAPTVVYTQPAVVSAPVLQSAPVPASVGSNVAPVVYPRSGQSPVQTERDSDQCSQWAGQQPNATRDRSVFDRGVAACMDARGYTLR